MRTGAIGRAARQVVADLGEGPGATDDEVLNDTRFGQVVRREEQFAASCGTGGEGHGEGTPDGAEVTLQAHLTQDHGMLQVSFGKLAAGQQQPEGDRQIQRGTILAYVRGSQIYRDPPSEETESRRCARAAETRSRPSLTAPFGRPTVENDGIPLLMSTSTSTGNASIPSTAADLIRESMTGRR